MGVSVRDFMIVYGIGEGDKTAITITFVFGSISGSSDTQAVHKQSKK